MPSFDYNPYSSTLPSAENVLRNLTMGGPPAVSVVQSLIKKVSQIKWSFPIAQELSSYVLRILNADDHSESSTALLHLLTEAMEHWEDNVLYGVLVQGHGSQPSCSQHDRSQSWLKQWKSLARKENPINQTAMVGLGIISRALDRLHQLTSLDSCQTDTTWWMADDDAKHWAFIALRYLNSGDAVSFSDLGPLYPCRDRIKLAATSLLVTLLKHDVHDWLTTLSQESLTLICQQLLSDIQVLIDPELPTSSSKYVLPCALLSSSLLSLIQWKSNFNLSEMDQIIHGTSLVENITQFAFPVPHAANFSRQPRWTRDGQFELSRQYALDLIYCWSLSSGEARTVFGNIQKQWEDFPIRFWEEMISSQSQTLEDTLPGIYLLHVVCRRSMRGILFSTIQRHLKNASDMKELCQAILESLVQIARSEVSFKIKVHIIRIMWILLSDRNSISTHDHVSRALWGALSETILEQCVEITLKCSSTDDFQQPLLLALLDLLDVQFSVPKNADFILSTLGADSVENLIYLVNPKEVRIDFMDASHMETNSLDLNSETPPANNLSVVDEKSIFVEQEEEKDPKGLDNTVRLSAATALSRLGYCSSIPSDEGVGLLISRICTAVNDFVFCYHHLSASSKDCFLSFDTSKRAFLLQHSVTVPDNKDFVITMLFTKQAEQQRQQFNLRQENQKKQELLDAALVREKRLQEEKHKYLEYCRSQSLVFRREMCRAKKASTQDARQLVAMHASERSAAERCLSKVERQVESLELQLQEAKDQVEESKKAEMLRKEELHLALSNAADLKKNNEDLRRQFNAEEMKSKMLAEEKQTKSEELESLDRRQRELETKIHSRDDIISDIKATNCRLQRDLEDLFADMVSLARIYQYNESEEKSTKAKHIKEVANLNSKLKSELEKNLEMNENMESLRRENEKLYKKLVKNKEKLEEERRERQEEAQKRKRNGPVSYINQLHQSTDSDRSSRDRTTRKESALERKSRNRSRVDKENSYYYATASSQRPSASEHQRKYH